MDFLLGQHTLKLSIKTLSVTMETKSNYKNRMKLLFLFVIYFFQILCFTGQCRNNAARKDIQSVWHSYSSCLAVSNQTPAVPHSKTE